MHRTIYLHTLNSNHYNPVLRYTYDNRFLHQGLKLHVPLPWDVEGRKEVTNQAHEDWNVVCDDLGCVEVP